MTETEATLRLLKGLIKCMEELNKFRSLYANAQEQLYQESMYAKDLEMRLAALNGGRHDN